MEAIGNAWDDILYEEFSKEYYRKLSFFLEEEYKNATVYPPKDQIFTAFKLTPPEHGYLVRWAEQGVLMLNTILTVRAHEAMSHADNGWQTFTDAVMEKLDEMDRAMVFILWGKPAQRKEKLITNPNHLVLKSAHPSPLSSYRGFFGSKPFSKTNAFLQKNGMAPIDWS